MPPPYTPPRKGNDMKIIQTADEAMKITALGTYETDYKNGEIWSFNGDEYYFSHLELSPAELALYNELNEGPQRI